MSNDTMPCGCEGHNASLCRFPALEAELAAEREARRRAERERDEVRARWAEAETSAAAMVQRYQDAREQTEEAHEALLRKLERPLGDEWTPPIFLCRTGNVLPGGALEHQAEVTLDEFDLRAAASTAGEASAVVMAMLCRELLARLECVEAGNAALLEQLWALERVMGAAGRVAAGANSRSAWDALDEALTAADALEGKS